MVHRGPALERTSGYKVSSTAQQPPQVCSWRLDSFETRELNLEFRVDFGTIIKPAPCLRRFNEGIYQAVPSKCTRLRPTGRKPDAWHIFMDGIGGRV